MTDLEPAAEAAAPPRPQEWAWATVGASIGPLGIAATPRGLLQVILRAGAEETEAAVAGLTRRMGTGPVTGPCAARELLDRASAELTAYFAGRREAFSVPLDWSLTSGFNRRVLRELAAGVPYGSVVSYQDLADRVGERGAARAVGVAMGSNPLPVVVPCHRVIESNGGLGGFGSGLEIKRALLSLEGVLPEPLF